MLQPLMTLNAFINIDMCWQLYQPILLRATSTLCDPRTDKSYRRQQTLPVVCQFRSTT